MKIIDSLFSKEKVLNETPHFKDQHLRYYTKDLSNGARECWAYPVRYKWGDLDMGEGKPIFLGKVVRDELTKPKDFYELPIPVQRGALRLFREIGVYQKI